MNFKTTLLMAIVFAIGVATVLFLNNSDKEKKEQEQIAGKLINVEKENIEQLLFLPSGIAISKNINKWDIINPVQYPADNNALNSVINMFDWAKIERTVSSDPSQYSNFGLDPAKFKLVIQHDNIADTLYVGDETPTGANIFARRSGNADVFLTTTSLTTNLKKSLYDLRDKKLLEFDTNLLVGIIIDNKYDKITLTKSASDWMISSPIEWKADVAKLSAITNSLKSTSIKEFIDEPAQLSNYGLLKPSIKIDFLLGENKARKTLLVGKSKDNLFYVKDDTKSPVFLVDSTFINKFNKPVNEIRNKIITEIDNNLVNKVELIVNNIPITVVKDTSNTWYLESEKNSKVKEWKISAIIREAGNLQIEDFVSDNPSSLVPFGLKSPKTICRLFQDDTMLTQLEIGNVKGTQRYIKFNDKSTIYLYNKEKLEKFEPQLKDLLEEAEQSANQSK